MTDVDALVRQGALEEAIKAATEMLRSAPADQRARVLLFELLCFSGAFDRAIKQIDVLGTQAADAGVDLALQVHRGLALAEQKRASVFRGEALPKFLLPPPAHVEAYVTLTARMAGGAADLAEFAAAAEDGTPSQPGSLDGRQFAEIRDADDRLAPVLEVFHGTEYIWLPLSQVTQLTIQPPRWLRDLLWLPATVGVGAEPPGDIFIPVLYPNTASHGESDVRLGRRTEWTALGDAVVVGAGQRVLLVDGEPVSLLDVRSLTCTPAGAAASA
jgi:type VI secretion system protein ImpE